MNEQTSKLITQLSELQQRRFELLKLMDHAAKEALTEYELEYKHLVHQVFEITQRLLNH